MLICGMQKTTLLDYPGHVAATLFTAGCNFRCPYCHNAELVLELTGIQRIPEEEIFGFLQKRRGILEGVCITGGEPTLQKDLEAFIRQIKDLGFLVKLDTNGYRPEILKKLLEQDLLNYVAMDFKASKEGYAKVVGLSELEFARIAESAALLMGQKRIPYEFRTTVVKGLHTPEEIEEIAEYLQGAEQYFLQDYRESENILCPGAGFEAFSRQELEEMAEKARKYIARVEVRGVE